MSFCYPEGNFGGNQLLDGSISPLASPYSGIVHHLSGPNKHALTQIFQKNPDRSMMHLADLTYIYFHYALGFATQTLACVLDSLVRVSRRVV